MSPSEFPFPKQNMSTNDPSPPETYYKQPTQPMPLSTHQAPSQSQPPGTLSARRPPGQPSMRTPTQAQGSNVYEQDTPTNNTRRPIDSAHATPTKTLGQRRSGHHGTARERYRATSSESEVEEQHNTRPRTRRPLPNPRTESYPPTGDSLPPPTTGPRPTPRRVSSGSASDSGRGRAKPRGLNFHEAREYMKSGRPVRPESWIAGQTSTENVPVYIDVGDVPVPVTPHIKTARGGRLPAPPMPSPASTEKINNRIGWALFLNSDVKNHLVATLGELIGTTMFLFFAFAGTQVANINSPSSQDLTTTGLTTGWNVNKLLYVSFSFGFSLMVNVWIFFRISGGLFNPAVCFPSLLFRNFLVDVVVTMVRSS
jgi:glycerol uptake facilitator-like aquaporin